MTKMYRFLLCSFLLIFSFACHKQPSANSTQTTPIKKDKVEQAPVEDAARPGWVRKRPIDDACYIGIGVTEKRPGDRDYKTRAKKDALQELCSQIEVKLNSNSYLVTINRDYKFQQDYLTASKSTVNTSIEGYRIIDEYENDKEYWVYFSLSREEYRAQLQQKMNHAASTALLFYEQAEQFSASYHYPSAILFYSKALATLKNYLNEAIEVSYKGKDILLVNACYSGLEQLFSKCRLQFDEPNLTLKFGLTIDKRMGISATSNDAARANLNDLPLRFTFISGKGNSNAGIITNERGKGFLSISKITSSQAFQEIQATPDLEKICAGDSNWADIKPFLDRITKPTASLLLTVQPPKFYSNSTEKNIGTALAEPYLMKVIDKKMYDAGLQLTMNKSEADWVIELDAATSKTNESYGMITCQLKLNMTVKAKGVPVYAHNKSDIKGIRLKTDEAGMDAYKNAATYIEETVVPDLLKLLFN